MKSDNRVLKINIKPETLSEIESFMLEDEKIDNIVNYLLQDWLSRRKSRAMLEKEQECYRKFVGKAFEINSWLTVWVTKLDHRGSYVIYTKTKNSNGWSIGQESAYEFYDKLKTGKEIDPPKMGDKIKLVDIYGKLKEIEITRDSIYW